MDGHLGCFHLLALVDHAAMNTMVQISEFRLSFLLNTYPEKFPGGSDGKESVCSVGDLGWISGLGRSPEEGNGYPLQYSCLENLMDRGAWWVQSMRLQRAKHDWVTLSHTHTEVELLNLMVILFNFLWNCVNLNKLICKRTWYHTKNKSFTCHLYTTHSSPRR